MSVENNNNLTPSLEGAQKEVKNNLEKKDIFAALNAREQASEVCVLSRFQELQGKFAFTEEVCSFNETKAQDFGNCIGNFLSTYNSQQTA